MQSTQSFNIYLSHLKGGKQCCSSRNYLSAVTVFGAIEIYGDFNNGETLAKDVTILPLDDSFDKEKAKQYARNHNIEYGR